MQEIMKNILQTKYGILFALLTLLYGFGLGGAFGLFEDDMKAYLNEKARDASTTVYQGDEVKMKTIIDKSWVYFKRAHLHANGLGTTSLVLVLLLSSFPVQRSVKGITAFCLGIGSLGYALFWMLAGMRAPGMGSTGMAKESLKWLAMPSVGLCFVGLIAVFVLALNSFCAKDTNKS